MTSAIAIIGSGFSGLGMAIRLKQEGIEDFIAFERAEDVGGTWRDNSYPGCACDVESHLYSFSFAQNPGWSRLYSGQAEIWEYLRDCADRFGIRPKIKFGHDVKSLAWDAKLKLWRIETSRGTHQARMVIAGTGPFSDPVIPAIPGLDAFKGKVMHSARWDHGYDLTGKRVAVIGTGASAIQFVPRIQPQVAKLDLYQRTPPWIVPRIDREITAREKKLFARYPWLLELRRQCIYVYRETLGVAFRKPWLMRPLSAFALRHLRKSVADRALRAKLTPNYTIGCKRVLISNDYYPALARENVEVVVDGIRELTADAVVTHDGTRRPVDAVIFGTGFQVAEMPFARHVHGKGGVSLTEHWNGSPSSYLGTAVHGFPNLFFLLGPNTGLGHNSVVLMVESQIEHVLKAVKYARAQKLEAIEPRAEAQARYSRFLESKMRNTVWVAGGCVSWYLDSSGRNTTIWPLSVGSFRKRVTGFDPADYVALG